MIIFLLLQQPDSNKGDSLLVLFVIALAILTCQKVMLYREFQSKAWGFVAAGWVTWATAVLLVMLKVYDRSGVPNRLTWVAGFVFMIIGNHLLRRDFITLRHRRTGEKGKGGVWK